MPVLVASFPATGSRLARPLARDVPPVLECGGRFDGYLCRARLRGLVPASPGEVFGGSLLLLIALVPTGLVLQKGVEKLLGHRFPLNLPERIVLAFYAAGSLLFGIASVPIPFYDAPLIAIVLGGGAAIYAGLTFMEKGKGLRATARYLTTPAAVALGGGFLGLLAFEVFPVWGHPFPNAWDGSVTALWMNLTIHQGTIPTSLAPYASAPVVYPLATTIWMTIPVLMLGWPIVQTPVLLPPLFLSLTLPAAYCWGARWGSNSTESNVSVGLLFAAFFGLVASWPRFYTGGSYDFAFALPLFIITVGLLPAFVRSEPVEGRRTIALGLLGGVLASLSLAAGEALLVLLLAYSLSSNRNKVAGFLAGLGRAAIVAVFEIAFLARSLVAWLGNGQPGYTPASEFGSLNQRLVQGELDPFVLWKFKISPFPWFSLELQILLAAGMILVGWVLWKISDGFRGPATSRFASDLLIGTLAMFVLTAVLLVSSLPGPWASALRGFTNLDQSSTLLFAFFEGVCAFPLVLSLKWLEDPRPSGAGPVSHATPPVLEPSPRKWRRPANSTLPTALGILVVLVLVIPLSTGAWVTIADGPGYITQNVGKTSNVTPGDVAVMEWAGVHLPSCSAVLVAPGSAGQFLPEYAVVHVIFPMNPVPQNQSYTVAVSNLTSGQYSSLTRSALKSLGVTEVLVTGRTSVSFLPFLSTPLLESEDFSLLFSAGDAYAFEFVSGTLASGCGP